MEDRLPVSVEHLSSRMPAPESAVVHPLVLLSVVDHYNRVARDTKKRVVGLLLGETYKGKVEVANSFACESSFPVLPSQC